ncbi:MAG TPA: CYTH domain-containing protein [Anaerovoracaceae bacterium]|nr:CYTH domain-containing protein [Anaerovoracaceae bacterium]
MEIELKYAVNDPLSSTKIFSDDYLNQIKDSDSEEQITMRAVYFDTKEKDLQNEKIAFRIRQENERIVATIKWNGSAEDGMHIREELNVPVTDTAYLKDPTVEIFNQSPMEDILKSVVGDKKLEPLMEISFIRRQMRIDTGKSISVISLDDGEIRAGSKTMPLRELEIELYSGSQEDMTVMGNKLAEKYNLEPENESKYKRGLELL